MEKLEKYIELKETIETFLKKRNDLKKRKDLYEPIKISLLDYLCILNIVIYGEREIFPEELKKEIKDEIKKVEEVYQINNQLDELKHKIYKISSEIFEYDIYPF